MKFCSLFFILFFVQSLQAVEEKTIHVSTPDSKGSWMEFTSSEEVNLKKLFELLGKSPVGNDLIKKAQIKAARLGHTLHDVVRVGDSSLTDTTLVRKFSPHSPEHVIYESRSVVYISRNLNWDDALLDLAHELTHFVYREAFNPYSENFTAQTFVKSTIEGEGGEVQAFLTECHVLKELFSKQVHSRSHCHKVETETGKLSFQKAVELFYHIGPYYSSFQQQLEKRSLVSAFSQLKAEKINFISSAYGVPYPIAALMEYDLVLNKVCENDKKRLAYMQQGPQRSPAEVGNGIEKFQQSYSERCQKK